MIASCGSWKTSLLQCSKEEGVTLAGSVETLGVNLRTRVKRLGAKEKARRKKCDQEEQGLPEELHERAGMVPARTWRVHAVLGTERLKLRR